MEFSGQLFIVFAFFLWCSLTESCSFLHGWKDLFPQHKLSTNDVTSDCDAPAVTGGSGANGSKHLCLNFPFISVIL